MILSMGKRLVIWIAVCWFGLVATDGWAGDRFDVLIKEVSQVDSERSRDAWDDIASVRSISDEAIKHRKRAVIRFGAADPYFVATRKDPKYQNPLVACRLALNPRDQEALDYIGYSHAHRGQDDDFSRSSLAGMYCRFGANWPAELRESIRREVTSYDGFFKGGTENHIAMRRTAGFLFGERFPDETFYYGLKGRQVSEECLKYMVEYGRTLYDSSQIEYLSPTYFSVNAAAWLHVAEFARDRRARRCAQAILDWMFADLALNYSVGVVVPPFERQKGRLLNRYQLSYARSMTQFVGWLYFDQGNTPNGGDVFIEKKYAPTFPFCLCVDQFAVSDWSPDEVIRNIAAKRVATPYMVWQSRANWPVVEASSLNPYGKRAPAASHNDPADRRYRMRSVYVAQDYAIGGGYFKENITDPLVRSAIPFGVVWRSTDERNMLLVAHPFWFTERKWEGGDTSLGDEDWMGISPFCQMVHWENAAVLLYDLPLKDPYHGAFGKGSPRFPSERSDAVIQSAFVYVPDTIDEKIESSCGSFLREGDVYMAIRPLAPGAHWQPSRHPGYMRLAMPGSLIGCVIEIGDRTEYGSFARFVDKVSGAELDTSRLADHKEVRYRSSRGNRLSLRHKSPGWLPDASVNGVQLDFDHWPICESPYVSCRDRILDINDGHKGYTIDWRGEWPVYRRYEIAEIGRKGKEGMSDQAERRKSPPDHQ